MCEKELEDTCQTDAHITKLSDVTDHLQLFHPSVTFYICDAVKFLSRLAF